MRVLELGDGDDVPRHGLVAGDALLAHHVRDAPEALGGARPRVGQGLVRAAAPAHDAQDAQAPRVGVDVGLEDVGGERSVRVAGDLLAAHGRPAAAVHRARGAAGDHVEDAVHPDHALRARRERRDDHAVRDAAPQALEELLGGQLLPFEVLLQERVVALGDGLEDEEPRRLDLFLHPLRDLVLLLPVRESDAGEEAVDPAQLPLPADRQVQRHDRQPEPLAQPVHHGHEVGPLPVEVVDDDDVRDVLLLPAPPHALGHDLYGVLGMHHEDGAIGRPLRHEGVRDETPVPRGVQHIDVAPLPLEVGHAHPERHPTLDLLLGVVEDGRRTLPP
nr:hypothetical protein [Rubrobacter marinus]